jgi:hypothetical protein
MADRGFEWKPIEYITEPKDGLWVCVVRNGWWVVNKDGDVLFWYGHGKGDVGTPQMNRDKRIAQTVRHPEATDVVQIPLAFYTVSIGDY